MRLKDQGKNSILLLNRSSVIAGALLLSILSIGLGYFIGFKTGQTGAPETEHGVEKPLKIPEEKRVLELPPPKNPQENGPTSQQGTTEQGHQIPPQESPKVVEQAPESGHTPPQSKGSEDKRLPNYWWVDKKSPVELQKTGKGEPERDFGRQIGRDTAERQPESQRPLPQQLPKGEVQGGREVETALNKPEKLPTPQDKKSPQKQTVKQKQYAIQFGAFPSRQGAEDLKAFLRSKGVNAYIVDKGRDDIYYRVRTGSYPSKKEADRQALQLEKQTGLKGFVTPK
jgi:cell division septation protein DedD